MKIGTFLLGGIAGAAAVVYLNRKSKSMLFSAFSSSSESMGKVVDKAKDSFSNRTFNSTSTAPKSFTSTGANGLSQVENIVKEDPSLKSTVNEILNENRENTSTIQ
ncbi:hypothetical protein GCM10008018_39570 [Paenibacillus marchantiophytorum]|uniref:YtxH domain-containing protein n=1 Tax=Paenibacillus marchantiophytorum TaxID=1619310 RepID=A0ABQ1EX87_9BACL|nr:hypothetical protein [Paenibacillus marchantiophytorum]GFZ89502.1 hypothetical protein GCM10008018_39570 [Paenibacillus marchantiophytorum]